MRTELRTRVRVGTFPLFALIIVAAFVVLSLRAGEVGAVPADVTRLGLAITSLSESKLSPNDAVASAIAAIGADSPAANGEAEAYLVRATDPESTGLGAASIVDRPIWLVRFSGFAIDFPGPVAADGTQTRSHTAHYAYVFVDASSGEPLDLQYWE